MTAQADSASFPSHDALAVTPTTSIRHRGVGHNSTMNAERAALRREIRKVRRSLPHAVHIDAARRVAVHLLRQGVLRPRARVGLYLALPEELDLMPTLRLAWQQQCRTYVPHITRQRLRLMALVPIEASTPLRKHRWGMWQLSHPTRTQVRINELDTILVPLVAFDAQGHRLGMGGGFYDRLLAQRTGGHGIRRPRLIGVAFDQQQLDAVPHAAHDVPMDAIVTPSGYRRCVRMASP